MLTRPRQPKATHRRLRRLVSYASVAVAVGCVLLWLRSHRVADGLALFLPGYRQFELYSDAGTVRFQYYDDDDPRPRPRLHPDVERWQGQWRIFGPRRPVRQPSFWQRLGFERHVSPHASIQFVSVTVPWWLVVSVFAVPGAWRAASSFRRHRRTRARLCPSCGYDLCGTPGRCPECGTEGGPVAAPKEPVGGE